MNQYNFAGFSDVQLTEARGLPRPGTFAMDLSFSTRSVWSCVYFPT